MKKFFYSKYLSIVKLTMIIILLIMFNMPVSIAQQDTSSFKNTIRLNVTNPMIFGEKAIILGYERVLKNNKSFSVNIGRAYFPKIVGLSFDSTVNLESSTKDKGFNISGDYRIYLKKENKYPAPRGVYVGPYYSFNYFCRTNNWTINSSTYQGDLQTELAFNIHTFGVELGYQFVFWDRVAVDMILIGPGVGFYKFEAKLNTALDSGDASEIYEALDDYLSEKFPGYDLVIDGDGFRTSGVEKTTSLGFRYMIMVGYRF